MRTHTTPQLGLAELATAFIVVLVFALACMQWPQLEY